MNTFNEHKIIASYKRRDIIEAFKNRAKRCDFVTRISNSQPDQKILSKWQEWFTFKKVPWAVTLKHGKYVLWKIYEGLTQQEIRDITNRGVFKL